MNKPKSIKIVQALIGGILIILIAFFSVLATGKLVDKTDQNYHLVLESYDAVKEYDGTELSNNVYKIVEGELDPDHELEVNFFNSQTSIGESDNAFEAIITNNGKDVTDMYDIEYVFGKLTVTQRELNIKTSSKTKYYDGKALYSPEYEITSGSLLSSHKLDTKQNQNIIEIGTIKNSMDFKILDEENNDVSSLYKINITEGDLIVARRPLTIASHSVTKVYDQLPISKEEYEITNGSLLEGDKIEITFNQNPIEVGKYDNDFDVKIISKDNTDVSNFYYVTKQSGIIDINPYEIFVKTADKSKIYDGEDLQLLVDEIEISNDFFAGDHIVFENFASLNDVGITDSDFTYKILDGNNNDVTTRYKLIKDLGNLIINPIDITIKTDSHWKKYDGEELIDNNYSIINGSFINGDQIEFIKFSSLLNVGKTTNNFSYFIKDTEGIDVSNHYNVIKDLGILQITPREIEINTFGATKVYDGTPLSLNKYEIISTELLDNHKMTIECDLAITDVGTIENIPNVKIIDNNGNSVIDNYIVDGNFESLVVNPVSLKIVANTAIKDYDGLPLIADGFTYSPKDALIDGDQIDVKIQGSQTMIGSSANKIISVNFKNKDGKDVNNNYEFLLEDGILIVRSSEVAMIDRKPTNDDGLIAEFNTNYNGNLYLRTNAYANYTDGMWSYPTEKFDTRSINHNPLDFLPSILAGNNRLYNIDVNILVDGIDSLYPYILLDSHNAKTDYNYDFINENKYSLDFAPIKYEQLGNVKLNYEYLQDEKIYLDYVKQTYLTIDQEYKELLLEIANNNNINNDNSVIYSVANFIKNCATYKEQFIEFPENSDILNCFLTQSNEGNSQHFATAATLMYRALGIPARYVTGYYINNNSNTGNKVYTSNAHSWVEVYLENIGWMKIEVTPNFDEMVDEKPEFNPENNIRIIKPIDMNKPYDGTPLVHNNKIQGISDILQKDNLTYTAKVSGEITNIGKIESNIVDFHLFNGKKEDVTNQYKFKIVPGIMKVYREKLIIETPSYEKVYDGYNIECKEYTVNGKLQLNHQVDNNSVIFTCKNKDVGTYINEVEFNIVDEYGKIVNDEYLIIPKFGSLKIKPRHLTIITSSMSKKFDGEPLVCHNFVQVGLITKFDKIFVTFDGAQINFGVSENTISEIIILDKNQNNVNQNYVIDFKYGKLEVTK